MNTPPVCVCGRALRWGFLAHEGLAGWVHADTNEEMCDLPVKVSRSDVPDVVNLKAEYIGLDADGIGIYRAMLPRDFADIDPSLLTISAAVLPARAAIELGVS